MKRLLIVINPVAGKGKGKSKLFELIDLFTKHGYRATVLPTATDGSTEAIIRNEADNFDLAVALGGDGTLNMVANAIINSNSRLPMGYIPLGSTNDFGSSLGLTKTLKDAVPKIAEGTPRAIDVGRFGNRHFIYIACTGLFAGASYMTSQQLKNALGHGAYVIKGFIDLPETQKTKYTVELDGETIGGEFIYAGITNTLRIGGFVSLPKSEVSFDDGLFELTLIKNPKNIIDAADLTNALIGSKLDTHHFIKRKVSRVSVSTNALRGWSIDGENGGENNKVSIEVISKGLDFVY